MSGLTLTPTNAVTDTVRPPTGKYRFLLGDGTNGTVLGTLYRMDSAGVLTALTYSDEQAQDAIGALFQDSPNVDFTYNDAGNIENAVVRQPFLGTVTATNKVYNAVSDFGGIYLRSNGGAAMADTLPALTAADNGYYVGVINSDTTASITFTTAAPQAAALIGTPSGGGGGTSYVLLPACRQTFIWTGTQWIFGAGNGNLTKAPAAAPATGDFAFFADTYGRQLSSAPSITSTRISDFTEAAQDAIGALLADSNTIDFTYDDAGNVESAVTRVKYLGTTVGAAQTYTLADLGAMYGRSNGGATMNDVLPALTAADNGYIVAIQNLDATAVVNFTTASPQQAAIIGPGGTNTYVLYPMCRQTFLWTGTQWMFYAGNNNILKSPTPPTTAGALIAFLDTLGHQTVQATPAQVAAASALATSTTQGALSAADFNTTANQRLGQVNILDYGADRTGVSSSVTALNNAIAALPSGGIVFFPPGTYNLGNAAYTVTTAHITLRGAARYNTNIVTTSTTADILVMNQYYQCVEDLSFIGPGTGQVPTRTAGFAINGSSAAGAYTFVRRCSFFYQWDCINMGNQLMNVSECEMRFFAHSGIVVNHNSDHQIQSIIMDNNAGALPTGGGVDVLLTASLTMGFMNIIHSNNALWLRPTTGVTVPSVKAVNCFFDTSVVGLMINGAGFVYRSEFTNCWFSSMSSAGISLTPTTAAGVDGIAFVNCDIYNNIGGTTNGIITNANVGKWKIVGSNVAGWTTGINLVAGAAHYPTILSNSIGAISAFGVNATGIALGAGAYAGFSIQNNDVVGNTAAISLGAFTATNYSQCRIHDNPGINPRNVNPAPAVPASAATYTNQSGFRQIVLYKSGATAPTVFTVNGISSVLPLASQIVTIHLDPGGTISSTYTIAPTWTVINQ